MTKSDAEKGAGPTDSMAEAERKAQEFLDSRKAASEEDDAKGAGPTDESTGDTEKPKDDKKKEEPSGDEDWEARFKGLQPKFQTLQQDFKGLEEDKQKLAGQLSEVESSLKTAEELVSEMKESSQSAQKAQEELQGMVDSLTEKSERSTLIMSEYPDLAALEAKGLLPQDVSGDDLKSTLDEMRSVLNTEAKEIIQKQAVGATGDGEHSSGSRTQGDDVTTISEMMIKAGQKGDMPEVARLSDLLVEAQNKEFAAQGVGQGDAS
jgi:chromosome segregation ATPase